MHRRSSYDRPLRVDRHLPRPLRRRGAVAALTLAIVAASAVSTPAGAASAPTTPTELHVAAVTSTSFTVTVRAVAHATSYRMYASTVASDVYVRNLGTKTSRRHVGTAKGAKIEISGLKYTSAPYYYRVEALVGGGGRWSATWPSVGLRPSAPTSLAGSSGSAGTLLSWTGVYATASIIEQATNSAFSTGLVSYRTRQPGRHFAPYSVSTGHTYYFRVRSLNQSTYSPASPSVRITVTSRFQGVRVLTYNSLSSTFNGTKAGDGVVASWSDRMPGQVAFLASSAADVIGIQEGSACLIHYTTRPCWRQVDSLAYHLARGYLVDDTDSAPRVNRYAGNYIIYQHSRVTPVGAGGHWAIGSGHYAAYQVFRTTLTGATFLFVTTHLAAEQGAAYDRQRGADAASMVSQARAYARTRGVSSVVYSGDFNSYPNRYHYVDTSGAVMASVSTSDAIQVAQETSNSEYNSINQYFRTPPKNSGSADHIYVSPGVGVQSWREMLTLSHGRFVGTIPSDHNPVYAWIYLAY